MQVQTPIKDCLSSWCGKPFDISTALEEYLDAGVPPNKLVFGLATYGRTFKLASPGGNTEPGIAAATGGCVNSGPRSKSGSYSKLKSCNGV
jgi:GH18 family chitinase